mmetsp:Transcript_137696/g.294273  ORF Transcript_137696/g.294273 Transcript_137696/m.294273 type:complete len:237 (-) Transcript_137696:41-751(-)
MAAGAGVMASLLAFILLAAAVVDAVAIDPPAAAVATREEATCRGSRPQHGPQRLLLQTTARGSPMWSSARRLSEEPVDQLGCLAQFYAEEDWNVLRTFQDARSLLVSYCSEDHDEGFCGSLGNVTFSSYRTKMDSAVEPFQELCSELHSVGAAERAWLDGQRAALWRRRGGARASSSVDCEDSDVSVLDGSVRLKSCGRKCRRCRRKHGVWTCGSPSDCRCHPARGDAAAVAPARP